MDSQCTLSNRELQVLDLIAAGHGNSSIAKILVLSVKTVESYVQHLSIKILNDFDKSTYHTRVLLARWFWMKHNG